MRTQTHLHGGGPAADGLPLQPDLAAIGPEAGPVAEDLGVLKNRPASSSPGLRHEVGAARAHLEARLQLTSAFPDVLVIDGVVVFAPVSDLEDPADRHLGAPADARNLKTLALSEKAPRRRSASTHSPGLYATLG